MADAWDDSAGAAFADADGATPGSIDNMHRSMRFDDEARARLPRPRSEAEARATGYSPLSWAGPTADDLLHQVAAVRAALADAPHGAGREPFTWDADRVRRLEKLIADHGMNCYTIAATM